jgi:hypothetical protein
MGLLEGLFLTGQKAYLKEDPKPGDAPKQFQVRALSVGDPLADELLGFPLLTSFEFDVIVREANTLTNIVTEHPIEDGSTIMDHVTNKPETLELDFTITDTPISAFSPLSGITSKQGRSRDEFARLEKMWKNKNTLTIVTGLKVYKNMMIQSLTARRDRGFKVDVSMALINYKTVETLATDSSTKDTVPEIEHSVGKSSLLGFIPLLLVLS